MTNSGESYVPPQVWKSDTSETEKLLGNRSTAGARFDKELNVGKHPLQLYSMGTPNGQKVTIMLEELLLKGVKEAEYDAHLVSIFEGTQFSSGFVDINPNSKIPALVDRSVDPPVNVFESGNILLYLAEKFGHFLPNDLAKRTETLNWLFWAQGAAPFFGGGFNHFFNYAPTKQKYPIDRFTMEVKRQLHVLDQLLANRTFIAGDDLTIADFVIFPWYGWCVLGVQPRPAEFLDVGTYKNVIRWAQQMSERPGVKRGAIVNTLWGDKQLAERHDASDIDALLG